MERQRKRNKNYQPQDVAAVCSTLSGLVVFLTGYPGFTRGYSCLSPSGSGLEGIQEAGAFLVGNFDGFPVEEVAGFFALDFAHERAWARESVEQTSFNTRAARTAEK